ncbi:MULTISPECIES: transcriptional repressor TraM [Rhizobium]|uniref:transcriptional repressor TraM n=1 Tax=Rhizobium TaxID=379 RepID=UPI001030764E|nr:MULTISPECIES: transcriptional repressor TraM [Rhizobium]NZD54477.1 transcriptional repressor TraM [Rhizobium leguminosarum]TAW06186.1 transcriptional regulator [Rhizobium ruizarguesonis]TAY63437.1 transcriptional regulator [Rhizobium ruizarguesonis]TAZ45557.1 transcriptional regulator [Rhizobium ruizarguesonis]
MNNVGSSRRSLMQDSELEVLAVAAIREHRHLIAADEAVYEEWTRASADPSVSGAVLKSLQDEYVARQNKSEAQQELLSEIIDALGYIPEVAPDGEE